MSGILYLVATPIGNLEDMTMRAIRVLREADVIAAEDTRNSRKLLNHFEIDTPMTSYHEFNRYDKGRFLIEKLEQGENIALITDAGTPGISDPGEVLVDMCYEAGITVVPVPGAVAGINALIASGQKTRSFAFEAFLPSEKTDKKDRRAVLDRLRKETRTIVLYEAPHRLVKTLEVLMDELGEGRSITICKELTKKHETFRKTTLGDAVEYYKENEPRGEYVLVIAGKSEEEIAADREAGIISEVSALSAVSIEDRLKQLLSEGITKKDASRQVAIERGMSRRDVYKICNELTD